LYLKRQRGGFRGQSSRSVWAARWLLVLRHQGLRAIAAVLPYCHKCQRHGNHCEQDKHGLDRWKGVWRLYFSQRRSRLKLPFLFFPWFLRHAIPDGSCLAWLDFYSCALACETAHAQGKWICGKIK